jgi:hypothetical protein
VCGVVRQVGKTFSLFCPFDGAAARIERFRENFIPQAVHPTREGNDGASRRFHFSPSG